VTDNDITKLKSLKGLVPPPPISRATFSRRSLHGQAASALGSHIISGRIPPGAVLPPEAELTQDLGVSRSVLREAILVLTAKGLLESRQRLGTRVRAREHWNLLDPDILDWMLESADDTQILNLFEIRMVVEPAMAAIAAERASPERIGKIGAALKGMEAAIESLEDFIPPDLEFHEEILRASGNEFLGALGTLVRDAVLTVMVVANIPQEVRRARLILHRDVFEAIEARNPDMAAEAMRVLVAEARSDLLAALATRAP
jgi:DNA-binding FadR family transcriptional regulator